MEHRFQVAGWIIFLICSGLFATQSLIGRDGWGVAASITFLIGCLVFLAPIARLKH